MTRSHGQADLAAIAAEAWRFCREAGFAGFDPYDGLKSRLLGPALGRSRWLRLAVIQAVKRSPLDLRPWLGIPPGLNPKALGLLMQAVARRPALSDPQEREPLADLAAGLASRPDGAPLFAGRAGGPGAAAALLERPIEPLGWGYDFPWQSKAFLQPAYFPTVVCTSFVVDGFAAVAHPATPAVTLGAAAFVREPLHRHEERGEVCYSYSPRDRTRVYNASLFAGKILARAATLAAPGQAAALRDEARRVAAYVVSRQRSDGAWIYGEADHWQWIDNLHTGFVLETLADVRDLLGEPAGWQDALDRGLAYYREHLFADDLAPRYYADRDGPLDSHTVAQAVLTLLRFADGDPHLVADARRVLEHGIAGLWLADQGGFAYQQGRFTGRTIFLRWSQAWMLRALCTYLAHEEPRP
ncbi:MAG: hypothetical protein R3D98_17575 [Candidatus Krumholzibacteriia bacterium]